MLLHKKKIDRINAELQFQLEKRRKKRAKKDARRVSSAYNKMNEHVHALPTLLYTYIV